MSKPIIFSGIQPTGNMHIGNYLGAFKNCVALQNSGKYESFFCIVDYHSLTGNRTADERRGQIFVTAVELLALGIDPNKSTFFVQSHVLEHTELAWIFNTITPVAELYRMTQFKDKAERQDKNINAGLLTYPALMAADILLYQGGLVPVGQDQIQHLELTRDTARWFNNRYGQYFVETKPALTEVPKVMSLLEPEKKMSKSLGLGHVIELADEQDIIEKKLKKAVTASEGGSHSQGAENLLSLMKEFGDKAVFERFQTEETNGSIKYGELKQELSIAIATYFSDFRKRRQELLHNPDEVMRLLEIGALKARKVAEKTMADVRKLIGVR